MNEVDKRHFWSSVSLTALRYNDAGARDSHLIDLPVTTQVKSPVAPKCTQASVRLIRENSSALVRASARSLEKSCDKIE